MSPEISEHQRPMLPPKTSERLLIEAWPEAVGDRLVERAVCTSPGRAQLARFIAERHRESAVECVFLDVYAASLAESPANPPNLTIRTTADLDAAEADAAALPLSSQGDAELTRELLQQAYRALKPDGLLLAATDNPRDRWLQDAVDSLGGRVVRRAAVDGVTYVVHRMSPLKRQRDFRCEFAFRDRGRLFQVVSRPGVFSHRRMDPGARRLIDALDVRNGERVLDVGCGWGAVALAAAARGTNIVVEAIDSNARAIQCTRLNAERNGLASQIVARLEAFGRTSTPGGFDAALGNPPYYANFRIAKLFVDAGYAALKPGGRLTMVTKFPDWYRDELPGRFDHVAIAAEKGYFVVSALKTRNAGSPREKS